MVNNSGIVSDGRPSSLSLDIIFNLLFMDKYIWDAIIFSLIQNCILYFGQSKVSFLELKKKIVIYITTAAMPTGQRIFSLRAKC